MGNHEATSLRQASAGTAKKLGARLFSFLIISDTHVNHEEAGSSSPWPSNKLANRRSRHVFAKARQMDPAFIVHLGDMVHPVPDQEIYGDAAQAFFELSAVVECPLHLTPGNHDVGDKPVSWMPAGVVTEATVQKYRETFGRDFYAFRHDGCLFIILNASLVNSGLPLERDQQSWLEATLAAGGADRVFMFIHYPLYVSDPKEPGGYDNIDEPGRSWLLDLIAKHAPEAVFSGHVHNFWYDVYGSTEMYVVPAISFVRQDYSELYKVEPGPENGRDDAAKLGFVVVDVHEYGHVAKIERSYGALLESGEDVAAEARLDPIHTKTNGLERIGVDLRHPWSEVVEIAPSGGVDEFGRKFARNDYPVLALWEMGVRTLRVPLQDLAAPNTRRRMELLTAIGHRFIVYLYNLPTAAEQGMLASFHHLVAACEIIMPWPQPSDALARLVRFRQDVGVPVFLSKLRPRCNGANGSHRFSHAISHGFVLDEAAELASLLSLSPGLADGFVFRVGREASVAAWAARLQDWAATCGTLAVLSVRLASDNPAENANDDSANANRVAEAVFGTFAADRITIVLDAFTDIDRGYFARTGLVDRRYNPRAAGAVTKNLHAHFATRTASGRTVHPVRQADGGIIFAHTGADGLELLVLPSKHHATVREIALEESVLPEAGTGRCINLRKGTVREFDWTVMSRGGAVKMRLREEIVESDPMLLCFENDEMKLLMGGNDERDSLAR